MEAGDWLLSGTALLLLLVGAWWSFRPPKRPGDLAGRVAVLVVGDLGRSPRMQYHALSLARRGLRVAFIGYAGTKPHREIISNGNIQIVPLMELKIWQGSHFPIGVVPPRTKSPTPESSTIASYVTLRKTKKIDLRTERPRSAVEQLCLAEGTRPRMTLEEQMERIRRHQQACLREKKKGLNLIGISDLSPSQSPAPVRENPFKLLQSPRKEEDFVCNPKEVEYGVRTSDISQSHPNDVEDTPWLKENDCANEHNPTFNTQLPKNEEQLFPDLSEPKERNPEEAPEKLEEQRGDSDASSPNKEASLINHKLESSSEESEKSRIQEPQEDTVSSPFEMPAQTSKGNAAAAALLASAETIHG